MSMQTADEPLVPAPAAEPRGRTTSTPRYSIASWLLTTDHKRIAILYLMPVTLMFFLGGLAISIDRLNLMTPEGGLVDADTYNKLFTIHGVIMVFFFLVPVIPDRAGQLLPADDDRRQGPGLSADQPAELVSVHGRAPPGPLFAVLAGGVDTGWTFYTPYSSAVLALQRRADDGRRGDRRVLVAADRA